MVSNKKKTLVQSLISKIKSNPIVGVVNLHSLPAQQLQNMRAMLRNKEVDLVMARRKLIIRALKEADIKNIDALIAKVTGMPALLFTDSNPFSLASLIQKNKSEAPAKAGHIAPKDITVSAGMTSFAPGPIISELAAAGIKTKVTNGKLEIIADTIIAKEGDEITAKLAETLKRLDIKPMEVGLDLVAVYEDGLVFESKQLIVDEEEYTQNITQAAQWAMNLALEAAYPCAETAELLLQKAFREAKAVAVEGAVLNDDTRDELLAKVEAQANSVKAKANL
jgi:large subunit ribosomal protein L10